MADEATARPGAPPGRSWKQTVLQIVLFQLVMRFFSRRPQTQPRDPVTGEVIPPLRNAFTPGTRYDVFLHISPNASSSVFDLQPWDELVWVFPNEVYGAPKRGQPRRMEQISYTPAADVFDAITSQHHKTDLEAVDAASDSFLDRWSGATAQRHKALQRKDWRSLYIVATAVPHTGEFADLAEAKARLQQLRDAEEVFEIAARGELELIEYMKPLGVEDGQSLLEPDSGSAAHEDEEEGSGDEEPHWKNHVDTRVVFHTEAITPITLQNPHLKNYIRTIPEKGLYLPIVSPSDLWLLERNFVPLNATLRAVPLNLTITLNTLNNLWWMVQSQLNEVWNPNKAVTAEGQQASLLALFSAHGMRERFMVKRIVLDTNPYVLAFSAAFMLLHSLFSFLAFKNDIQFWKQNESMQGLSAMSVIFSFFCELIVGLYLYDSEETSLLILFEIFLGIVISAWKVTKAINVSLRWSKDRWWLPRLELQDKKDYEESDTKKYDAVAIKFMSVALLPCCLGYAIYSLKTKKYRSWYSFVVSSLAGTVYIFGFIMMTPQLYINYKLKSVDNLPWRAFTYKALNTFVDDIAAFIVDMPLMHRLACFRDDVIFVCYLYQRWIYSVDKSRSSGWVEAPKAHGDDDDDDGGTNALESLTSPAKKAEDDVTPLLEQGTSECGKTKRLMFIPLLCVRAFAFVPALSRRIYLRCVRRRYRQSAPTATSESK